MKHKSIVWAKIPRAGLGNKLLVLAKAMVFARLNGLELITTDLVTIQIGPILRREKSLRFYRGYFNQDSIFKKLRVRVRALFANKVIDPKVKSIDEKSAGTMYVFHKYMFWMHFFDQIRDYHHWVKPFLLREVIKRKIISQLDAIEPPQIAVHIRMGDFKELSEEDNFQALDAWNIRTPIAYFVKAIQLVREIQGKNVEVTVFSNGSEEEIAEVLALPNVVLAKENLDLIDMLLISKSKVILPSPSSTFSLLGAYLSEAIILHHPDFFMRPIRPEQINQNHYEGPIQFDKELMNEALIHQLKKI